MINLLWSKDSIVVSSHGKASVIQPDDPVLKQRKAEYRIAVLETTPQIIKALPLEVEQAAVRNYPQDYKICYEKLREDEWQTFGAPDVLFDKIKAVILPESIDALIPYQIAIRAVMQAREDIAPDQPVIFLDDSPGEDIIFTVFRDGASTAPRIISRNTLVQDFNQAKEDYIREERGFGIEFKVITNSSEIKDELVAGKAADSGLIALWEMTCPSAEGLSIIDKSARFVLFEQTYRKKLRAQQRKTLVAVVITASVAAASTMICFHAIQRKQNLIRGISSLTISKQELEGQLTRTSQTTYHELIGLQQDEAPAAALAKIFDYAPLGFRVESINIKRRHAGDYELYAYIIPGAMTIEEIRSVFPALSAQNTMIRGVNAFRISYGFDADGNEFPITTIGEGK